MKITAFTVDDVPMIQQGDDLAKIVAERAKLKDDDIVVFASTIVSKAEGRRYLLETDQSPRRRPRSWLS